MTKILDILQGIEAGADDFASKARDYTLLMIRIKILFRIKQFGRDQVFAHFTNKK